MFGKPEWFTRSTFGAGLTPVTWQGWAYALALALATILPSIALFFTRGWPEAIIWALAMIAFAWFESKMIVRAMQRREEDKELLYILDEKETRREEVQTGKFEMHVAQREP